MKKSDLTFLAGIIIFLAPFFLFPEVFAMYKNFNAAHGMIMSFIKFAILATTGEVIGLRITRGVYNKVGFGIIPRAIVWGFLGLGIKMAFIVFATGMPNFLNYLGFNISDSVMASGFSGLKLLTAFSISVSMNVIFAPLMMTFHKITDEHITRKGGTIKGFFSPIQFSDIFTNLNWKVMWDFVFMKTIPFFWIPAHTITFMLPKEYQILFAALLGVALGVILAFASLNSKKEAAVIK